MCQRLLKRDLWNRPVDIDSFVDINLEEFKLGENGILEIFFGAPRKFAYALKRALLVVRYLVDGRPLDKDLEAGEAPLSGTERRCFVLIMPAYYRGQVKARALKARIRGTARVLHDDSANILILDMEYRSDRIESRTVADIARFIDEDGKLLHQAVPSEIKMPRDTPRLRDSLPCVESYNLYSTESSRFRFSVQEILPNLLEEVSLEVSLAAEEKLVGCRCLRIGVLDGRKLNGAEIVRNLREAIALRCRVAVDRGLLGEDILNCIMECLGNKGLSVVVVNLYFVELLQVIKMVEQEYGKIATNLLNDTSLSDRVVGQLVLFVREHSILKWQILEIDPERSEVLLPEFNAHVAICIVAVHKRREVQGNVLEALSAQGCFVAFFMSFKRIVLFMEDEADEIVLGFGPWVAGLIDKYGKLPHGTASFDTKNAEGKPPAFGSPPCEEDHLSYTTSRSAESIVGESEHKFVTIEANTCSTYREAA